MQCLECSHMFSDDVRGRVKCPECLTNLLITCRDRVTGELEIREAPKPPRDRVRRSNGGKVIFKKTISSEVTVSNLPKCPTCRGEVTSTNSVLGKMAQNTRVYSRKQGGYIYIKTLKTVRVCRNCGGKLVELTPEKVESSLPVSPRAYLNDGFPTTPKVQGGSVVFSRPIDGEEHLGLHKDVSPHPIPVTPRGPGKGVEIKVDREDDTPIDPSWLTRNRFKRSRT